MAKVFHDILGRRIQLTGEGWAHIIKRHDYMPEFRDEIGETLLEPDEIRRSNSVPETTWLYYKWYYGTPRGDKWVCVVVKALPDEAFLVSAYVADKIKEGELLWPI